MRPVLDRLPSALQRHRALVTVGAVLVVLCAALYGWRTLRQPRNAVAFPPVQVAVYKVQTESVPQALEAVASLQAVNEVNLAPELAGRVVAIHFEPGTSVRAGEPLVQLFDEQDRADRAAAVARADFAKLQLDRARELAPSGAASRQLLQQRESELAQARAQIRQIDALLVQRTIRAPFSGEIGIRRVQLGQYVNAGDVVASLADLEHLYVNFTVPQQDLGKLHVDGKVSVHADAFPDRTFTAEINAIDPVVSKDTRNVWAQATLANPDKLLRPGMYVTAMIQLPPRADSLVIPATAIQTTASGDSVFVVREGKAVPVAVKTGQRMGERVVAETGLKAGDVIVALGVNRVQPGGPVQVTETYTPGKGL
jgi:multidrug efflux system membrane fusion protein